MSTVAITHDEVGAKGIFLPEDLERLRKIAQVKILGGNERVKILPQLKDVDVLLGSWGMPAIDGELLAAAPKLKAVCYAAGSVKGFARPESYDRGIVVTSAWKANAIPVAEVTVALIILANKRWFEAQQQFQNGGKAKWAEFSSKLKKNDSYTGNFQATVGIIGLGAIGQLVAERLRSMDLRLIAFDPHAPASRFAEYGCESVPDLETLAEKSHIVTLHAPNIPATDGMLSAHFFKKMRDGATFINTARGKIVVESALIAELQTGRISAHLDVTWPEPLPPESPLWKLPNCWLTPHVAGSQGWEVRRMGRWAIDDCIAILEGRPPKYPVSQEMLATMA